MGYKKMKQEISFADLILKNSMGNNRCLEQLNCSGGSCRTGSIDMVKQ